MAFLINKYNEEQSTLPSLNLSNQSDRLGIAFKQPYIQDIPDFLKADATNAINTVTGGIVRGGVIGSITRSVIDGLRIGKFMVDPARGLPFIAKQTGLQRTNVDYGNERGPTSAGTSNAWYGVGTPIAQAGINAFGGHLKRHGLIPKPSEGGNDKSGYAYIESSKTVPKVFQSRPNKFKFIDISNNLSNELDIFNNINEPIEGSENLSTPENKPRYEGIFTKRNNRLIEYLGLILRNSGNVILKSYSGGPDSVYGIGKTEITSKEEYRTIDSNKILKEDSKLYNYISLDRPTLETHINKTSKGNLGEKMSKLQDFRKVKSQSKNIDNDLKELYKKQSSNYGVKGNMESRLGIGTQGDKLNKLPIVRTSGNINSNEDFLNQYSTRDLIRFFIEAIDTDNPTQKDFIQFRAFLDSLGDSYGAKWNSFNFVGNPEQFFNYESFSRDIKLSFKIAALSPTELQPMYTRLNGLISQLMPNYAEGDTRARGSYVKLTVGSYLDRVPGFITSLGIDWKKDYPWEINIDGKGDISSNQVLPHLLDINMSFQPIHNFIPKKVTPDDADVPFITLNSRNGNTDRNWINSNSFRQV